MTKYSNQPVEPGFYQGEAQHGAVGGARLTGRKSGRTAPRDHVRQPAWEETLQKHDLLPKNDNQVGSNADYNPDQGQLFDTQKIAPRDTRSDADIARSYGAATGEINAATSKKQNPSLGAMPGFMPSLTTKQKVGAVQNVGDARVASGADRGSGAPFAEIMQDRQAAYDKGRKTDWYMGTEGGDYNRSAQGAAASKIQESAARVGNTSGGHSRAVAMTSPQMGWKSEGSTDDTMAPQTERMSPVAGTHMNISAAEDVVRTTNSMFHEDPEVSSADVRAATDQPGVLGGTPAGLGKAGENRLRDLQGGAHRPYPIQDIKSQKAPNFEASLNLSHIDPAVQRVAAQSYTVDRHDGSGVGVDVEGKEFKRRGSYEAIAMTGRRAGLKNRELPPNEQAIEWESRRNEKGLGQGNQMFVSGTGTDGSAPVVRPDLVRPATAPPSSRTSRRGGRSIADDLGLDF